MLFFELILGNFVCKSGNLLKWFR